MNSTGPYEGSGSPLGLTQALKVLQASRDGQPKNSEGHPIDKAVPVLRVNTSISYTYVTRSGKTGLIRTFCISKNTYLKYSMRCPSLVV